MYGQCLPKPEEGIGSETRVTDSCEPAGGCQELNPGPVRAMSALNMPSHLSIPACLLQGDFGESELVGGEDA